LRGEGRGEGLSLELGQQYFENSGDVVYHVIVPDADDAIAKSSQIGIALSICSAFGVLTAVDLDNDMPVTAREISVNISQSVPGGRT
jgi:hypothetical protein